MYHEVKPIVFKHKTVKNKKTRTNGVESVSDDGRRWLLTVSTRTCRLVATDPVHNAVNPVFTWARERSRRSPETAPDVAKVGNLISVGTPKWFWIFYAGWFSYRDVQISRNGRVRVSIHALRGAMLPVRFDVKKQKDKETGARGGLCFPFSGAFRIRIFMPHGQWRNRGGGGGESHRVQTPPHPPPWVFFKVENCVTYF